MSLEDLLKKFKDIKATKNDLMISWKEIGLIMIPAVCTIPGYLIEASNPELADTVNVILPVHLECYLVGYLIEAGICVLSKKDTFKKKMQYFRPMVASAIMFGYLVYQELAMRF